MAEQKPRKPHNPELTDPDPRPAYERLKVDQFERTNAEPRPFERTNAEARPPTSMPGFTEPSQPVEPPTAETDPVPEASAEAEELAQEQPGHYAIKGELGRGGQAIVYVAHDHQIGRDVAFKQLLIGGEEAEERFLRESRVAGQLEHPSVVPVYEVGRRENGALYCAMRLVRGRTLAQALKEEKGQARLQLLSQFVQLCQAIAYAHERGVVHRDIKPENVMLGAFGETVLLDWGIAKLRGHEDDVSGGLHHHKKGFDNTQEGDVVGTPAYMSPEQALGEVDAIDEQSDVWSLGAVLYELFTGQPPFTETNAVQLLVKIAKEKIAPVQELAPRIPRELAYICERALQRDKKQRYKTALDLADDIEAFRAGVRVTGVTYSTLELLRRWLARNVALTAVLAVALVLLAIAGARIWRENRASREYLAEALVEKSEQEAHAQHWARAAAYGAAARVQSDTAEARFRAAQRGQLQIEPLWRLELPGSVDALAVSRDGRTVAIGLGGNQVALFDAATGASRRTIDGLEGKLTALVFAPDGQTLATATDDRTLSIWSVESGDRVSKADGGAPLRDLQFSPDGMQLAAAGSDGHVRTWATAALAPRLVLKGHEGPVTSVDFSFDASSLVSSGEDGTLRLWTLPSGSSKIIRGTGHQPVSHVAFAASDAVVSASSDGTVRFFNLNGDQLARINTSGGSVTGLAVPAIKGPIAALQQDAHALFIDPMSRLVVAQLEGDDAVGALGQSADGTALVTASRDGRLRGWKVTSGARELRLRGPSDFPGRTALALAPKRAAVGDQSGHITLWNTVSGQPDSVLDLAAGPVSALAFTKDGKYLAASGHEDKGFLFEVAHGNRVALEGHTDLVNTIALSPDGATAATGSADGSVRLWAVPSGMQKRSLTASGMTSVLTVAFSPDGTMLAAAGEDRTIRVWELANFHLLHRFEGSPASVLSLAFSPHGSILASAGGDEAIRTWRLSTGKLRSTWLGHGAHVFSIAFAPDGETLASASLDGTIRMWDVHSGRQVSELQRLPEARAIAFTAEGAFLVSTGLRPAAELSELGDKSQLSAPREELEKQLLHGKLKLDGIRLVDDLDALTPRRRK